MEHRHEPDNTTCVTPSCGQPMQRIGEDVSEELDIVPAEFFVHRHIYGKWVCKCCQPCVRSPANRTSLKAEWLPADWWHTR